MNHPTINPTMYALLIGVDCYLKNPWYKNLKGCVRDVSHVDALLQNRLHLSSENIFKLTASNSDTGKPSEAPTQWPTYENMVAAFKHLQDIAQPGDQVYIHYSGHGGRCTTIFPKLKGERGLDESLVPTDIGCDNSRYLRDVELTKILHDMVKKELIVTMILDSCHSGGMMRGIANADVRGSNEVDITPRPTESLVGTSQELTELWNQLAASSTRGLKSGNGWLLNPQGYVLLAACRSSESAYEYAFDGHERNGALTYWLLDSLQDIGPGLSYKVLHDRILAKVHSQFENQTPQLQGEGDRAAFGSDRVQTFYSVPVMQVDMVQKRLLINAGQVHGLRKEAQFAIYPHGTTDFTKTENRQAIVQISELGATDSWATPVREIQPGKIEQGAQAMLIGLGTIGLVQKVGLVLQADIHRVALQAAAQALQGNGWIEVAKDSEKITYQLAVNEKGEYEIWDCTGKVIRNLRPVINIDDEGAPAAVAKRLEHLAKYRAVLQLSNHDTGSPLSRKLVVERIGKRKVYDPTDPPFNPEVAYDPDQEFNLQVGEWIGLRIKNVSSRILNVTVLDLQPDWGISQIHPYGTGDYFDPIDPTDQRVIAFRAELPELYTEGTDIIKVFASLGTTNFRWLELPPLDQPLTRGLKTSQNTPTNPLEEMLAIFAAEQPPTRTLIPSARPTTEWITEQLEVFMHKT